MFSPRELGVPGDRLPLLNGKSVGTQHLGLVLISGFLLDEDRVDPCFFLFRKCRWNDWKSHGANFNHNPMIIVLSTLTFVITTLPFSSFSSVYFFWKHPSCLFSLTGFPVSDLIVPGLPTKAGSGGPPELLEEGGCQSLYSSVRTTSSTLSAAEWSEGIVFRLLCLGTFSPRHSSHQSVQKNSGESLNYHKHPRPAGGSYNLVSHSDDGSTWTGFLPPSCTQSVWAAKLFQGVHQNVFRLVGGCPTTIVEYFYRSNRNQTLVKQCLQSS